MSEKPLINHGELEKLVGKYSNSDIVTEFESLSNLQPVREIELSNLTLFPLFNENYYQGKNMQILKDSIQTNGITIPLFVYQYENKNYIVNGVKRFLVAKNQNMKTLPCIDVQGSIEDVIIYVTNNMLVNKDNGLVQGYAFKVLMDKFQMSEKEIQRLTALSHGQVANLLRLLKLTSAVKEYIIEGKLSTAKARLLITFSSKDQIKIAKKMFNLSVRECENLVRKIRLGDYLVPEEEYFTYKREGDQIVVRCSDDSLLTSIENFLKALEQ